jgi:hypothetical protein
MMQASPEPSWAGGRKQALYRHMNLHVPTAGQCVQEQLEEEQLKASYTGGETSFFD